MSTVCYRGWMSVKGHVMGQSGILSWLNGILSGVKEHTSCRINQNSYCEKIRNIFFFAAAAASLRLINILCKQLQHISAQYINSRVMSIKLTKLGMWTHLVSIVNPNFCWKYQNWGYILNEHTSRWMKLLHCGVTSMVHLNLLVFQSPLLVE